MFYEVRIFDTKKNLKKIVPTKELSRRHWADFEKSKVGMSLLKNEMDKQKIDSH